MSDDSEPDAGKLRKRLEGPIEFTIAGTGPQRDTLVDKYGDRDWLTFPGYVEDLQGTFDRHDALLLPSTHEAFGIVVLEALACGLPVVTSNTGGQTDIVEPAHVGECAPPTADAQASALQGVLERYDEYQAATEGHVDQHFSRGDMVDGYEALYRSLIA